MLTPVADEDLAELYAWVDSIPLSKAKKSIARDFADGVSCAEIVHHYFPRLVQLHNYSPTSSSTQKMYNWETLNHKVFKKIGFTLPRDVMESAAFAQPGAIEPILQLLRTKLAQYQAKYGSSRASRLSLGNLSIQDDETSNEHRQTVPPIHAVQNHHHHLDDDGEKKATEVFHNNNKNHSKIHDATAADNARAANPLFTTNTTDLASASSGSLSIQVALEEQLEEQRNLNQILEGKIAKLEQLLRLKDAKIAALTARLHHTGLLPSSHPIGLPSSVQSHGLAD